jgi:sulfur-oxidizing protein SoxZ
MMHTDIGDGRLRLPAKIRQGEIITVHSIVTHPMDTGLFRDASGDPIPPFFIQEMRVEFAGVLVARFEWSTGISKDPVMSFPLNADREGTLRVTWTDNAGAVFRQSAAIAFDAA